MALLLYAPVLNVFCKDGFSGGDVGGATPPKYLCVLQ